MISVIKNRNVTVRDGILSCANPVHMSPGLHRRDHVPCSVMEEVMMYTNHASEIMCVLYIATTALYALPCTREVDSLVVLSSEQIHFRVLYDW